MREKILPDIIIWIESYVIIPAWEMMPQEAGRAIEKKSKRICKQGWANIGIVSLLKGMEREKRV